jgi:cytochrome c biogenesis protein CcdA
MSNKGGVIMAAVAVYLMILATIAVIAVAVLIYFLPTIIAYKKNHANRVIILVLNIVFGWTFLGWIGCLIWSFVDTDGNTVDDLFKGNKYDNLEKLQKLKESGALTDEEFEKEKQKILK